MKPMREFLRREGPRIMDGARPVILKGVNLGGWLMMEGYLLHSPNVAEQTFKKNFEHALGSAALLEFEESFRKNFICEQDFRTIADWGCNCLRLPFHYRIVESAPHVYEAPGIRYLDQAMEWAERYGLRVILDLHAAPGAQNHDWHSDSLGQAELWEKKIFQDRTVELWRFLARRYRDNPAVAGYDLLNEAVIGDMGQLNAFYRRVIEAVRSQDLRHLVFIEGNRWATEIVDLDEFPDEQSVLSIHFYGDLDFTFNFTPHLRYPPPGEQQKDPPVDAALARHADIARRRDIPVLVGEFGVNGRGGYWGEERWLKDTLAVFDQLGFHWTYWTYKAVKNSVFPDGILSYFANPAWVKRLGPLTGWENYAQCWPAQRKEMEASWRTEAFVPNGNIVDVFKQSLAKSIVADSHRRVPVTRKT